MAGYRQEARAVARLMIEESQDGSRKCYTPEIYERKRDAVSQYVLESYFGPEKNGTRREPNIARDV